ncbi:Fc.00g044750.m01.CDS01 [Cosmosporella sp. VM-42]
MSHLKYYAYPGAGEWARDNIGYSQAVRVGDRVECSGQGGWKFTEAGIAFPKDLNEEIDQAFRNVETALKDAGGKGWSQVFRVNSYHTVLTPEVTVRMVENFRKWMPDHKPIWTEIGVAKLGADGMNVEIEVSAHDSEVAKEK